MSKYDQFDTEKFLKKINQLGRENHIKIGIMIKNYNLVNEDGVKKEVIKEYADGLRFKLGDLNEELLDRLINFVERLENSAKK